MSGYGINISTGYGIRAEDITNDPGQVLNVNATTLVGLATCATTTTGAYALSRGAYIPNRVRCEYCGSTYSREREKCPTCFAPRADL